MENLSKLLDELWKEIEEEREESSEKRKEGKWEEELEQDDIAFLTELAKEEESPLLQRIEDIETEEELIEFLEEFYEAVKGFLLEVLDYVEENIRKV